MGPSRDEDDGTSDGDGAYRTTWDRSDPDTITSAVVRAVASVRGVAPEDMAEVLNDALDPDALVRILRSGDGDGDVTVTFRLQGLAVTARDDGTIRVAADGSDEAEEH